MPRDRFKAILRFVRFDDLETRTMRLQTDKLAPIRFVSDKIIDALNKAYSPNTNLTIDEHLCRYKGKCPFRQYIPSKPDKYGIKVFILADSKNFYPLNLEIYTGKGGPSCKPDDLTLRLTSILKPGHVITGDNYFTSLNLSRKLLERNLYFVGTIRKIRKEIPKQINDIKRLTPFTSNFFYSKNISLTQYIPRKGKSVLLLSNIHFSKETMADVKQKPIVIADYNSTKSGVDKLDQNIKEFVLIEQSEDGHASYFSTS